MKQQFFLIAAIIAIFSSCQQTKKSVITVIDYDNFEQKEIKLSEFADDINYIPLSDSIPMESADNLQYCGDSMFCIFIGEQIAIYDLKGNYMNSIGRKGKGPEEYTYGGSFTVAKDKKQIFVLGEKKILVYSFDGSYIKDIDISNLEDDFCNIEYNNNCIFLSGLIINGKFKNNWVSINTDSNKTYIKANSVPEPTFKQKSLDIYDISPFYKFDNHFYYWNKFNDTIFDIYPDRSEAKYLFAKNSHRNTPENYGKDVKNILNIDNIKESKNYLFINYWMDDKTGFAYLDKTNNKFATVEQDSQNKSLVKGFINDLDGGLNFSPNKKVIVGNSEFLINSINAFELKDYVSSDTFKNSKAINPEKKKALEQLADSLKEDSNPVLVLVKLKQ